MKRRILGLALVTVVGSGLLHAQTPAVVPITQEAVAVLKVPGFADFLVADGEAVWATNQGCVEKLQRDQPRPVAAVSVPNPCGAMEIGFGAVWVANCQDRSLYRIDRQTARVAATIPTGLADRRGELSVATIPVGPTPRFLAAGEGSVWTLNQGDGTVSRIDPATNGVAADVAGPGGDIATRAGRVWVRAEKILLSVIDPGTNRIVERLGPPAGSGAVGVAGKLVWVTAHDIQTVWVLER